MTNNGGIKRDKRNIVEVGEQHKLFIPEQEHNLKKEFTAGAFLTTQVESNQIWMIYHNGIFFKRLEPGPHVIWNKNIFWGSWRVYRVNIQTILLDTVAVGRIRGPSIPEDGSRQGRVVSHSSILLLKDPDLLFTLLNLTVQRADSLLVPFYQVRLRKLY